MKTVDPDLLALLMTQAGYPSSSRPTEELLLLATVIVEHCASIASNTEQKDRPMVKQQIAGEHIRAEWGLGE